MKNSNHDHDCSDKLSDKCFDTGFDRCDHREDDLVVTTNSNLRICGIVKNCHCKPVANATVELIKVIFDHCGKPIFKCIAKTCSDCNGMYLFEVLCNDLTANYEVIATKPLPCGC